MAKSLRIVLPLLAVIAIGVLIAGGLTIGLAQTITLLAIASTVVVFYLLIQTSLA